MLKNFRTNYILNTTIDYLFSYESYMLDYSCSSCMCFLELHSEITGIFNFLGIYPYLHDFISIAKVIKRRYCSKSLPYYICDIPYSVYLQYHRYLIYIVSL